MIVALMVKDATSPQTIPNAPQKTPFHEHNNSYISEITLSACDGVNCDSELNMMFIQSIQHISNDVQSIAIGHHCDLVAT